jgi:hypothetical protein
MQKPVFRESVKTGFDFSRNDGLTFDPFLSVPFARLLDQSRHHRKQLHRVARRKTGTRTRLLVADRSELG